MKILQKSINSKFNDSKNEYFILILVSISFVISDMTISLLNMSEIILIPLMPILLLLVWDKINRKEWLVISLITLFLIINMIINNLYFSEYMLMPAIAGTIKIVFYSLFVLSFYKYMYSLKRKRLFLKILNYTALVVVAIGIYIYIAILTDTLPFEFFWTFSRIEPQTYYFRGTRYLVRMRSLFSEPAHLGFYLNLLLGVNLFNRVERTIPLYIFFLLIVSIMLTFSFSSIAIMIVQVLVFIINSLMHKDFEIKLWELIIFAMALCLIIYISWDFLDVALIQRSKEIISGEDNSAFQRIIGSWQYIDSDNLWFGNGVGNTPIIWNNYAYFLSEMGLFAFLFFVILSIKILYKNAALGLLFILLNFQRGGYLSPAFYLSLILIMIYSTKTMKIRKCEVEV